MSLYRASFTFCRRSANFFRSSDSSTWSPSSNSPSRSFFSYGSRWSPSGSGSRRRFQSALPSIHVLGISSITRYLRTARSTIVALTSSVFASSSISVPTWPGRRSSGGANSTTSTFFSNSGTGCVSASAGPPITWSICEPLNRTSRPRRHIMNPSPPTTRTSSPIPPPTVTGVRLNALSRLQRSSRIGAVLSTVPGGSADHDRHRLERGQVRLREDRVALLGDLGVVARGRRPERALEAGDPRDVGGPAHPNVHLPDRLLPLVADRVPEQLVVVGEPVHRALDPVDDLVGVAAGDRRCPGRRSGSTKLPFSSLVSTSVGRVRGDAFTDRSSIG